MDEAGPDVTDQWFAANLMEARKHAGLSQKAVAEQMRAAGYRWHPQTVSRVEAGEQAIRVGEAFALARITGTTAEALARPPQAAQDVFELRQATGKVWQAQAEAQFAAARHREAREALAAMLASLREAGKADALAEQVADAERALKAD